MWLGGGDIWRQGCEAFDRIHEELTAEGGGPISIYYHPCEWATTTFWHAVHFARGQHTPLAQLKLPPPKPEADAERDFAVFASYLRHVTESGARAVSGAELPGLYPDLWAPEPLSREACLCLACGLAEEVSYQPVRHGWASAAEAFGVAAEACARLAESGS